MLPKRAKKQRTPLRPSFKLQNWNSLEYNSLRDPNLTRFFSSPMKRCIIANQGLVNRKGEINEFVSKSRITDTALNSHLGTHRKYRIRYTTPVPRINIGTSQTRVNNRNVNQIKLKPLSSEDFKKILTGIRSKTVSRMDNTQQEHPHPKRGFKSHC